MRSLGLLAGIVFLFLWNMSSRANSLPFYDGDSLRITVLQNNSELKGPPTNGIIRLFREKIHLSKRVKSAILAFPFPFGMVGLHRIYLGTKPYVPVAYIATLGGVFGILPLIDFCTILFHKDFDHYQNNGQVFMWINE
jgi:hypothetical protein